MTLTFISVMANLPLSSWLWACPQRLLVEGQLEERRYPRPYVYILISLVPSLLPPCIQFLTSLSGPSWHATPSTVIT